MKRTVCIFAALLLLLSCGNKKEEAVVVNFSREEIPEQQELRDAEPVVLEDTYNNPLIIGYCKTLSYWRITSRGATISWSSSRFGRASGSWAWGRMETGRTSFSI